MTKFELEEIAACKAWEVKLGQLLITFRDLGQLLTEVMDLPPKVYHAKVDEGLKILEGDLKKTHRSWSNLNFLIETNWERKMTACKLSDEEKEIMRLRYISGLTFKQIARRLKVEDVKTIHDNAVAKLGSKGAMENDEGGIASGTKLNAGDKASGNENPLPARRVEQFDSET